MKKKYMIIIPVGLLVICLMVLCITGIVMPDTPREPEQVLYFCGISHCRLSGMYGEMALETMNVWNNPDPNRGGVHHQVRHGDKAIVIGSRRVSEGPGGMWYRLKGGGWTNGLHVTAGLCTFENIEQYTSDC
jgi:hypothetical protein